MAPSIETDRRELALTVVNRWVGVGADYRTFFVHRAEPTPRVHRFSSGLTFSVQ